MSNITLDYVNGDRFILQIDGVIKDITPAIPTLHIKPLLRKLNIADAWKDAKNSGLNILPSGDPILTQALTILFGTTPFASTSLPIDPTSKDWKSKMNDYKSDIKGNAIVEGLFTPLALERTKSETLDEFKHIQFFMFESGIGGEKLGLEKHKEFITAPQLLDPGPSGGNIDKKLRQPDKYWVFPKLGDTVNITENAMSYFGFYNLNTPNDPATSNWKLNTTTINPVPPDNNIFNCTLQFPHYSVENVLLSDPSISNYNKGNPTKNDFINQLSKPPAVVSPDEYDEVIKLTAFKLLGDALMNIIYKIICEYMKSQSSISVLYDAMGHPVNMENTLDEQVNIKELVDQRVVMSTSDGTVHSRNIINGVSSLLTGGAHELLMADLFTPTKQSILFVLKTQLEIQMNAIIKNNNELLSKWKVAVNTKYAWMEKQYSNDQTSYSSYTITTAYGILVSGLLTKMKLVCTAYYDAKLAEINSLNITDDPGNVLQDDLRRYITQTMLPFLCSPFLQIRYKMVENLEGDQIRTENGYLMREIEMPAFSTDIQSNPQIVDIINNINQINADIIKYRNGRRESRPPKPVALPVQVVEPKKNRSKQPSRLQLERLEQQSTKKNQPSTKKTKTLKSKVSSKKRGGSGSPMIISDESKMVISELDNDYLSFNEKYILYYACKLLNVARLDYDENHIEFIYMLYSLTVHWLRINVYLPTPNYQDKINNAIQISFKTVMTNEPIYMGRNIIRPNIVDSLFESFDTVSDNINQNSNTYDFANYARVLLTYFEKISQNDKILLMSEEDIIKEDLAVKNRMQLGLTTKNITEKPTAERRYKEKQLLDKSAREKTFMAKRNIILSTPPAPPALVKQVTPVKQVAFFSPPPVPPIKVAPEGSSSPTIEPAMKTFAPFSFNKDKNIVGGNMLTRKTKRRKLLYTYKKRK